MQFDPAKDAVNLEKHGLSLAFGERIFDDPDFVDDPTFRIADEEPRMKATGLVDGKLYTAVYVWRGQDRRYISVRRANRAEENRYRDSG